MNTLIGTAEFLAPEMYTKEYTIKCDIWAVGVAMYILLAGEYPFDGDDEMERY